MAHVLVVGAGLAGARTCAELRRAGFSGRLTLMGEEPAAPYDRPPLSKDPGAEVDLRNALDLDVWTLADEVLLDTPARGLRSGTGTLAVECPVGEIRADAVVVATGASPLLPTGWAARGVHLLRTRPEAETLWDRVRPGSTLDIVGGGWIGCEVAATAAARGARVRLHEAGDQLLPGRVPARVGDRVAGWLVGAGVEVRTGEPVTAVRQGLRGPSVQTGERDFESDDVLVALGVAPRTDWLIGAGLGMSPAGSVLVDPWGRTRTPGVLAVGDAAARWSVRAGSHLSAGHWTEALNAPAALADALAGWVANGCEPRLWAEHPVADPPDPVPYVFSDIGPHTVQVLGDAAPGPDDVVVWRRSDRGWSAFRLDGRDRLLGVVSTGRPRDVAMSRRLMLGSAGPGPVVDPAALADPSAPVLGVEPASAGG